MRDKPYNKNTNGEKPDREKTEERTGTLDLVIRIPAVIGTAGVFGLVFGALLAFWCYRDYLNGNETASVGLSLMFLFLFGIPGMGLTLYGSRVIKVKGEEILFRDIFLRSHYFTLDEVRKVQWALDGLAFMGACGRLFKVYEYSASCEKLLQELERRGVELDIPGRAFAFSQMEKSHPCLEKRRFTVRSASLSLRFGGKLTIDGRNITVRRSFKREISCLVTELGKARVLVNKEKRLKVRIYHKNGTCLFLAVGSSMDYNDGCCVFSLLRYLAESGVTLYGNGMADEGVQCMMRSRFISTQEEKNVLREEYERILPVLEDYGELYSKLGLKLAYGICDRQQEEEQEEDLLHRTILTENYKYGFFYAPLRNGNMLYHKKEKQPLYQYFIVIERAPKNETDDVPGSEEPLREMGSQPLLYYHSIPTAVVKEGLEFYMVLFKKKQVLS